MNSQESVEIPGEYFTSVIRDVIGKENITDYTTFVTSASAKGDNYIGLLFRIKITGLKNGEKTELSLVLKIPPQSILMREKFPLEAVYIREVNVYNLLLPELCSLQDKFKVPQSERFIPVKCYRAESETLKEMILLEDMCVRGFRMTNRKESLDCKHLRLMLKNLASYHALSFALKKVDPEKFKELSKMASGMEDYNPKFRYFLELSRNRAIAALDDPYMMKKVTEWGAELVDKMAFFISAENVDPYSVMCHGDCWINNTLFRYQEDEPVEVVLLDWQITRHCSPLTDIAYLFFSGTDYDLRKNHFQELLDYYHSCLAKSLNYMDCNIEEHYPKAVFVDHQKKILPYGLFMSFMLLPAVLGEVEDVPDMDALLAKEEILQSDLKFENKQASNRYQIRMRGVVQTCLDMDLI